MNAIENERYDPSLPLAFAIARVFALRIEDVFTPDASRRRQPTSPPSSPGRRKAACLRHPTCQRSSWTISREFMAVPPRFSLTLRVPKAHYRRHVMTTRTPARADVLSSVAVRLSLRVLVLLGILPGGFVV